MYMLGKTLALNRSTAGLRLSKLHLCSVCVMLWFSIKAKDGREGGGGGGRMGVERDSFRNLTSTCLSSDVFGACTTCFSSKRMITMWRNCVEPTVPMRWANKGSWRCSGMWGEASTNTLMSIATMSSRDAESFLVSCGNCCFSPA